MPITNVNSGADKGTGRTTFRPPWVKGGEAPQPVPMPTTPWSKRNSITPDSSKENGQSSQKDVKLQSREVKVPVTTTTTKKTPVTPLKKKEVEEEKKPSGSAVAENPGKFARPVLKKVAKVEEASKPPGKTTTSDKKSVPVGKSKTPVVEESSEEEEESSYEEVTETETETESDSDEPPPPPATKNKKAPAKDESPKQVAAPTKPVPAPVVKPPLTRQISARNAPVEKPAIPATHAKFTPPKAPFSKRVVPNKSVEQTTPPPPETNKSLSPSSKIQSDVQKDLSKISQKENGKELPKENPKEIKKDSSKVASKEPLKEASIEPLKEALNELSRQLSKESSKVVSKEPPKVASKEPPKVASKEPPKVASKEPPKVASKEPSRVASKEPPNGVSKEPSNVVSKDVSNGVSKEPSKDFVSKKSQSPTNEPIDDKVVTKKPFLKQNSAKPIQSPKEILNNEIATKSEPETIETPKLTTEPTTEQTNEINRPINKKFGLTTGKSTETKSAPEKTVSEKVVPSKQVTLKPIPEKTVQPKPASESKIQKPELKPIPPKPEPVPEQKQIPTKSSLKPIPPKPEPDTTKAAPPPPPPPPSGMGPPPPPPPPPGLSAPPEFERKPMTEKHKQMLEKLKTRPRRRPDWSDMMKEVESGRKLKHVQCNDRSSPIISCKSVTNIQGQYIFETEKANVHNVLLKQIQGGVRLKPTKTNDRSRPILEGLRKFRRQMTIEEQIQKSESRAQLNVEVPVEESEDEMDDIDKLRDDLQSTKQMLALELRNKEAQERENKRLAARVQILEAELEREKWQPIPSKTENKETPPASEALLQSLKKEAEEAQKTSKLLERKYQEAADQLDAVKNENERQKITIANLERRLAQQGGSVIDNRRQSEAGQKDSSPEPELELSEEEEDEDEEKKAERIARRLQREVKMLCTKLIRLKDKERAAKRERENLRDAIKKNEGLLKIEHKKFKKLQREVDKMAAMMKDDDEGNGSDDETKPPAEDVEDEEDEESEEEEEEDSDSEDESEGGTDNESESEAEDATDEKKKINYEPRIKRHDGRVSALKKGNYLLQANVDRLQDEINKMREKSVTLQRDLDSVLSELG